VQSEREQDGQDWQIKALRDKLDEVQEANRAQFETLARHIEATVSRASASKGTYGTLY
jgi:hypothetical protein